MAINGTIKGAGDRNVLPRLIINGILHKTRIFCGIVFLIYCQLLNGSLKAQYKESDFKNWYVLSNKSLSQNGKWSYFQRNYDDGKAEGVLLNTISLKNVIYQHPTESYLDNDVFIVKTKEGNLFIRDLKSNTKRDEETKETKETVYENVSDFLYNPKTRTILLKKESELLLTDKSYGVLTTLSIQSGVMKYRRILNSTDVILEREREISLLSMSSGKEKILWKKESAEKDNSQKEEAIKILSYRDDSKGKTLRFLIQQGKSSYIKYYTKKGEPVFEKKLDEIYKDYKSFSFGEEDILVMTKPVNNPGLNKTDTVEIWSSHNKGLKPRIMKDLQRATESKVISLKDNKVQDIPYRFGVSRQHLVFHNRYILEIMELENEDFMTNELSPKLRLRNMETGEVEFMIDKTGGTRSIYPSKEYPHLFYFKDKDWWLYNVKTKDTLNLTSKLKDKFYTSNRFSTRNTINLDGLYFSKDFTKVYLTGETAIWVYDLKKDQARKIAFEESGKKEYSLQIRNPRLSSAVGNLEWNDYPVVNENYLLLRINRKDEFKEGIAVWRNGKLSIVEEPKGKSFDNWKAQENTITYTSEDANTSFILKKYDFKETKELYSSNKNNLLTQKLPKAEVIHWNDKDGNPTYLTVILPPDYDPGKKYPTVVKIYENKAKDYRNFVYPTLHNQDGFNRSLLAVDNYIVLLPRITYKANEPGESALSCVEETIEKAAKKYSIDKTRLGLTGGSFGGFETNYILTRSNLFKTGISGASLADITASYFSVKYTTDRPNIWVYTDQSFGFTGNFYDMKEVYYRNNPVFHADNIKVPLLLWSGKEDYHVNWNQSVAMFVALASQKKEVKLLLFPRDGHALGRRSNQTEATTKFKQWFDYYLKDNPKPDWFKL
ncbi:alpha/beta hydrolase family protein [Elizabethkingia anophelis]|uniref:alpha/beta hydrolase family protein n=1 Tax=Elizabethkingia anophelis TaxID=1117645 RepID=UPI000D03005A|nr:prolyl oligopeptidase family serine peptidase [Elizabethkingia anophelis]MCL1689430.1 prolyl oligopeptidase family serine peptidase [Elizabethkingia anophelis]MDV4009438.1 hypothetical protein [Elizabethkingia anophelis]MYY46372.1 S9 family peptidase [Elizabethkingia anophelis]PRQ84114.1 hypothetical protein CMT86_17830 [Elizabethkingia anophelis]PRQ85014.1 hypothetical protein CMT87_02280 [Elizabethkingia anophelis]